MIGGNVIGSTPSISDTEASVGAGEVSGMREGVGKLAVIESCNADDRRCGIGPKSS